MKKIDLQTVWNILKELIEEANRAVPGASGIEKRAWVVDKVLNGIEAVDHLLPVIGAWADLPVVNGFEKYLVRIAVERCYAELKLPE